MIILEDQFKQMVETVDDFFGRDKTPNEARKAFLEYRDESLKAVAEMPAELLRESPFYAGLAFLGMVQFVDGSAFTQFKAKPSPASLAKLREAEALNMRRSAADGWAFLSASHPEVAVAVIALCAMGAGNKVIENALKPFQPVVKPSSPSSS